MHSLYFGGALPGLREAEALSYSRLLRSKRIFMSTQRLWVLSGWAAQPGASVVMKPSMLRVLLCGNGRSCSGRHWIPSNSTKA